MKYAIISDIHANPPALERVLADAERCGAKEVVCAGDVVGYGPDPAGAIRILRERGIPTVRGNHDAAVAGWRDTDGMIGQIGIDVGCECALEHLQPGERVDFQLCQTLAEIAECLPVFGK